MAVNTRAVKGPIGIGASGISMASIDEFPGIDINKVKRVTQHLLKVSKLAKILENYGPVSSSV